jgi:hypothetical protein
VQKWFVAGAEAFVRRGQLTLLPVTPVPALAPRTALHPDDPGGPYVFRIDLSGLGIGTSRVMFSRPPHDAVTAFHLTRWMAAWCRSHLAAPRAGPPGTFPHGW